LAELSFPWPDTTDPGPQVGDGRPYTSAEWDQWWEMVFAQMSGASEGVLPEVWNELEVTDPDVVNKVDVDTGAACIKGKGHWNTVSNRLTVASAAGGTTRKDRVILRCDWTGGVGTQYTTRLAVKQGTQADPPALTQTDNTVWEISLAQFVVDDAGNISGLTDERAFCHFATKVDENMLDASIAGDGLSGGAGSALSVNVDDSTIETNADALRVKAGGIDTNELADGAATAVKCGADMATQAELDAHINLTTAHGAVSAPTASKMMVRDGSGRAQVADPSADADIATKGWVNSNLPGGNIPVGGIIIWSGAVVDIPANWQLCDGTNGTPNLRNRFVYGAGSGGGYQNPDASGGNTWKNLAHTHGPGSLAVVRQSAQGVTSGSDEDCLVATAADIPVSLGVTGSGGSASQDIMPPWYALCYIQRIT